MARMPDAPSTITLRASAAVGPQRTAVDAVADTVAAAVQAGEIAAVDSAAAAAVIIGIVLQTAIFHIYGKLSGGLTERASALACAAIAAVTALAEPPR